MDATESDAAELGPRIGRAAAPRDLQPCITKRGSLSEIFKLKKVTAAGRWRVMKADWRSGETNVPRRHVRLLVDGFYVDKTVG
jgi:hypothetical protein